AHTVAAAAAENEYQDDDPPAAAAETIVTTTHNKSPHIRFPVQVPARAPQRVRLRRRSRRPSPCLRYTMSPRRDWFPPLRCKILRQPILMRSETKKCQNNVPTPPSSPSGAPGSPATGKRPTGPRRHLPCSMPCLLWECPPCWPRWAGSG